MDDSFDTPVSPPTTPAIPPPIPAAPPTIPGQIGPVERRTVWPIPIGVLVIVFSAWTLLSGSMAIVQGFSGLPFMDWWFSRGNPGVSETITQIYSDAAPGFLISGACLLIAAALGLTGGIALLCRMQWCVLTLRLWVVVKLMAGAAYAVTETKVQTRLMITGTQFDVILEAVIVFIFGAAVPIFVLVWFARQSIRADCGKW